MGYFPKLNYASMFSPTPDLVTRANLPTRQPAMPAAQEVLPGGLTGNALRALLLCFFVAFRLFVISGSRMRSA